MKFWRNKSFKLQAPLLVTRIGYCLLKQNTENSAFIKGEHFFFLQQKKWSSVFFDVWFTPTHLLFQDPCHIFQFHFVIFYQKKEHADSLWKDLRHPSTQKDPERKLCFHCWKWWLWSCFHPYIWRTALHWIRLWYFNEAPYGIIYLHPS